MDESFPRGFGQMRREEDEDKKGDMDAQGEVDRPFELEAFPAGGHFFWRENLSSMGSVTSPTASTPAFLMMSRVSMKKP